MTKAQKRKKGLYGKFIVRRTDGRDAKGNHGCDYFVLDITHDPFAVPAIAAYIEACRANYPNLAKDLREMLQRRSIPTLSKLINAKIELGKDGGL